MEVKYFAVFGTNVALSSEKHCDVFIRR